MINIVLSSDDSYAKYMSVTMASILYNKKASDYIHFYILDGGIAEEKKIKIHNMSSQFCKITFINVPEDKFKNLSLNIYDNNHITIAAYFRLLIPSLINVDKCIYLDCDIICRSTISDLWNIDIDKNIAGAVIDIDNDKHASRLHLNKYFNSGVLLINLKKMREENIQDLFFNFIKNEHKRIVMHDQDVLNCVLNGKIYELDKTWNCQITKTHQCKDTGFYKLSKYAHILHFIGSKKPWTIKCNVPQKCEYWKYLQKTPWKESNIKNFIRLLITR